MFTFEDADLYEKYPNDLRKMNTFINGMYLGSNHETKGIIMVEEIYPNGAERISECRDLSSVSFQRKTHIQIISRA